MLPGAPVCDLIGAGPRIRGFSQYCPAERPVFIMLLMKGVASALIGEGSPTLVTIGVDTHLDSHVAVALDQFGRHLGLLNFPATTFGYAELLDWASALGTIDAAGIEGTGSYGVGLARFLRSKGILVFEVDRPKRRHRRRSGKSDPIDAEAAARSVQAGIATGEPKSADGIVEMIRVLRGVKRSAVKSRNQVSNHLRAILVCAPTELRSRLSPLSITKLVSVASQFRSDESLSDVYSATRFSLRFLSCRYLTLSGEISALNTQLSRLVQEANPALLQVRGVGVDTAAALLIAAGDNPDRLRSEAAFAHLCGVAPIPASSGKIVRHRLNRGGNRDANRALHVIALSRMSSDPRTRAYVARRTAEGKRKPEIIRCLKRYIAREVYKLLILEKSLRI